MKTTIIVSGYAGLATWACFSEVGMDVVCADVASNPEFLKVGAAFNVKYPYRKIRIRSL
jgi:UDP-glucose 6-dehydrogenase